MLKIKYYLIVTFLICTVLKASTIDFHVPDILSAASIRPLTL